MQIAILWDQTCVCIRWRGADIKEDDYCAILSMFRLSLALTLASVMAV
jgi:hypothetical protein